MWLKYSHTCLKMKAQVPNINLDLVKFAFTEQKELKNVLHL